MAQFLFQQGLMFTGLLVTSLYGIFLGRGGHSYGYGMLAAILTFAGLHWTWCLIDYIQKQRMVKATKQHIARMREQLAKVPDDDPKKRIMMTALKAADLVAELEAKKLRGELTQADVESGFEKLQELKREVGEVKAEAPDQVLVKH